MSDNCILAIETSAHAASCAVLRSGKLLASAYQDMGLTHSRTLMPMVRDMLANSGIRLADCDTVAVANGPGSFTGIRIGVAAAKGLALGANLKCVGVSTLEAMARMVAFERGIICCAMDARRGEVYNAIFASNPGELVRLVPDRAVSAEEAAQSALDARRAVMNIMEREPARKTEEISIICIGDGAELCYNYLGEIPGARLAPPHLIRANAIGVAFAAEAAIEAGENICSPEELGTVYLRLSQAERERAKREAELSE